MNGIIIPAKFFDFIACTCKFHMVFFYQFPFPQGQIQDHGWIQLL